MVSMNMERRFLETCEIRAEGEEPKLAGYAARFMSLSHDLGGFRERILPGAFKRSLETGPDVLALLQHDEEKVLGRRSVNTLRLFEDGYGLRFEIKVPNVSYANDTLELVRRGDIQGMSFGFIVKDENLLKDGEQWVRELRDVDLFEISVVTSPAYPQTQVSVRSDVLARIAMPPLVLLDQIQFHAECLQ